MKHYWLISLFGISLLSINGCYTRIALQNDIVEETQPIIIIYPEPPPFPEPMPLPTPVPPDDPPDEPSKERVYKYRNLQTDKPSDSGDRERIRNTGGRNDSEGRGRR
jgi:hypothetical protein